ncbi:MAG: aminotransferase class V-fold PLP-dependent enzyme, partial [Actinomycetota bacterium]
MSFSDGLELVTAGDEINLDYAATTPALRASVDAVLAALPTYGSVHRGGGARSRATTDAYERARASVARFVDAGDDHVVVFVRNSTEAINLAAASLEPGARVLCSPFEHHANLLPWRGHDVEHLEFAPTPEALVAEVASRELDLLAVSGASNVTGEVFPVRELAAAAHARGARILVDAAQLAPHRPISVRELDVDFLALSGHKLYAPFGSGVLVARREALADVPPLLKGGGAVRVVTLDDVGWADVPHRLEAGTPNVLGAIALAAACDALAAAGMEVVAAEEAAVARRLWEGLGSVAGCTVLRGWPAHDDRVGVASFTVDGWESRALAEHLASAHGIAVRAGLFCAHPFVAHLLGADLEPGADPSSLAAAVRASIGLGVRTADVDRLVDALSPRRARRPAAPRVDVHRHLWPDELVSVLRARTTAPYLDGTSLVTDEGAFEVDV